VDYGKLSPDLAKAVRAQQPRIQPFLNGLGSVKSVQYLGVMADGSDTYDVRQENGVSKWMISLNDKGVVVGARVTPGP
jgi:hypothetical protein